MDQVRRQTSFPLDEPEVVSQDSYVAPALGLSDDEAFEALAASMSLFEPLPVETREPEPPLSEDVEPVVDVRVDVGGDVGGDSKVSTEAPADSELGFDADEQQPVTSETEPPHLPAQPMPVAWVGPISDDLPELLPFDGGSRIAQSGQGWLDPMAFNRHTGDLQPGRIEPPRADGFTEARTTGSSDVSSLGTSKPGSDSTGNGFADFDDIVMIGLLTGELSADFIAAAQATECAPAVPSAADTSTQASYRSDYTDGHSNRYEGTWWRPTTVDELQSVVETYLQPVVAVTAGLIQKPGLLDEVVAKTFLSAWVEGREGVPSEPVESWLYSICLEMVRRKDRHQNHGAVANTRYPAPAHRGSEELRHSHARQAWEICLALGELDDLERTVLCLAHHRAMLHTEIAAETHSSLGAVKSCLYRASNHVVNRLSHRLDDAGDDPGTPNGDGSDDLTAISHEDHRAEHTWYLAGVADGSSLSALDRQVIKDIRAQLSSEHVWREPTSGLGSAILSAAADNEGTLVIRSGAARPNQRGQNASSTQPPEDASATDLRPERRAGLEVETGQATTPGVGANLGAPTGVGGIVRTTVQYDPELGKARSSSRLRRVVHPLKATTGLRPDAKQRQDDQAAAGRRPRRSPEAATAPVPIQPAPDPHRYAGLEPSTAGSGLEGEKQAVVSHGKVAALAIGVIVLAAAIILAPYLFGSGPAQVESLDFELNATAADADATAVVNVSEMGTETLYRMWLGGLNATDEQHFYAAWLVDPETVVEGAVAVAEAQVLGSFRWTVNGEPIALAIDGIEPRFDHLIITLQSPADPPGPSGVVVLEGSVRTPDS